VPVKQRQLSHGDRIRIGDTQFLFLLHDGDVSSHTSNVQLEDGSWSAARLSKCALMTRCSRWPRSERADESQHHDQCDSRTEELQQRLLELLFEVVPAERGAILLTAISMLRTLARCSGWTRRQPGYHHQGKQNDRASRNLERRSDAEKRADRRRSSGRSGQFGSGAHERLDVRALKMIDRTLGVIYLETGAAHIRFESNHLQLTTAIAGISAWRSRTFGI